MVRTCTGTTGACQQVNRLISQLPAIIIIIIIIIIVIIIILISQLPAGGEQAGGTIQPDVRSLPKGTDLLLNVILMSYMFPIILGTKR